VLLLFPGVGVCTCWHVQILGLLLRSDPLRVYMFESVTGVLQMHL
jgi:hypothetical protein